MKLEFRSFCERMAPKSSDRHFRTSILSFRRAARMVLINSFLESIFFRTLCRRKFSCTSISGLWITSTILEHELRNLIKVRVWHSPAQPSIIYPIFLMQQICCLRRAHPPQWPLQWCKKNKRRLSGLTFLQNDDSFYVKIEHFLLIDIFPDISCRRKFPCT